MKIEEFLASDGQTIDVRTPQEFAHSHIPGACNIPLFTNDERARVGTTYKKIGTNEAIALGVELVGPKLSSLFKEIQNTTGLKKIYCWRGGMRSGFLTSFLQSLHIPAVQLQGGYKAFRRKMLSILALKPTLRLIGGMTGSGKTELLAKLKERGDPVIDLEGVARHRGSAFGELEGIKQPSTEQFENELAFILYQMNTKKAIWVEDESRLIGSCAIPTLFYETMQQAPLYLLEAPLLKRIERIYALYGFFPGSWWKNNILKLQKRLGGERAQKMCRAIDEGRFKEAITDLLDYYDATYSYSLKKHKGIVIPYS